MPLASSRQVRCCAQQRDGLRRAWLRLPCAAAPCRQAQACFKAHGLVQQQRDRGQLQQAGVGRYGDDLVRAHARAGDFFQLPVHALQSRPR